jgi:hypothetical protein
VGGDDASACCGIERDTEAEAKSVGAGLAPSVPRISGEYNVSGSLLRNLIPSARRTKRTSFELVAAWLGGARLGDQSPGELHKRRHNRWRWERSLLLWLNEEKLPVYAYDLGEGGAGLCVPRQLEIGAAVRISAADDQRGETCIAARVVHVSDPDTHGFFPTGIEFANLLSEREKK